MKQTLTWKTENGKKGIFVEVNENNEITMIQVSFLHNGKESTWFINEPEDLPNLLKLGLIKEEILDDEGISYPWDIEEWEDSEDE